MRFAPIWKSAISLLIFLMTDKLFFFIYKPINKYWFYLHLLNLPSTMGLSASHYSRIRIISPPLKIFSSYKMRKSAGRNPLYPLKVSQHWIISRSVLNRSMQKFPVPNLFPVEFIFSYYPNVLSAVVRLKRSTISFFVKVLCRLSRR